MLIVDRFEGDWAVVEYNKRMTFNLPRFLVPAGAKEGDVIIVSVKVDTGITKKLNTEVSKMASDLFQD
ncbi:DUF3006 domain-containing protein [Pelotomaculum terephthalicicum JT]|uniref:DUF3006 domain-containing protein n=1 Tax=Pelotomaculum TaxID=191373 RepID=UPI0009CE97A4|nr:MULTISPECIES: DUF3006 domain-containing protein [Pelotomaculum]MCG9969809.1 DUF3006 domain-containing protein [Pelotomaculum terephthalicicum JT]OPX90771.1 MAG: hypothetical protein A4E54_00584 [Pelotomaculum sp. PtaB.Bin117]OPY59872.1 MAG: hypothetical protein A4E56_03048 [Pelotomaculum sp. PtaU1.Bin065]